MVLMHDAPVPAKLDLRALPARSDLLTAQPVRVNANRWRRLLDSLDLPPAQGFLAESEWVRPSRGDVFRAGDADINEDTATQLYYASLAWGLGAKARHLTTRLERYARSYDFASQALVKAWQAVRDGSGAQDCYEVLMHHTGRGRIPHFGPAFATKFLYFASGTRRVPQLLILDAVVARRLQSLGVWEGAPTYNWRPSTYQGYCDLLVRWADEATQTLGRPVAADEVELALFQQAPAAA